MYMKPPQVNRGGYDYMWKGQFKSQKFGKDSRKQDDIKRKHPVVCCVMG